MYCRCRQKHQHSVILLWERDIALNYKFFCDYRGLCWTFQEQHLNRIQLYTGFAAAGDLLSTFRTRRYVSEWFIGLCNGRLKHQGQRNAEEAEPQRRRGACVSLCVWWKAWQGTCWPTITTVVKSRRISVAPHCDVSQGWLRLRQPANKDRPSRQKQTYKTKGDADMKCFFKTLKICSLCFSTHWSPATLHSISWPAGGDECGCK